jgi:hypothetical protein
VKQEIAMKNDPATANSHEAPFRTARLAVAILTLMAGTSVAQTSLPGAVTTPPPPVMAPSSATTSRGPGLVSGAAGSPQTILIPGYAIPGTLLNNGNGSSTVMVPGNVPQVILTPR